MSLTPAQIEALVKENHELEAKLDKIHDIWEHGIPIISFIQ